MKTCTLPFNEGYAQAATTSATTGTELVLQKGKVVRMPHLCDGPAGITCRQGMVWITESGNAGDVILQPGEKWFVQRPTLVLLEAIDGDAAVSLL